MWNSAQCAVQGRGHVKTNIPCQDKAFYLYEKNTNVIALADGAGSASLSHFGAEYVTKKICELLTKEFDVYYNEEDGAVIKRLIIRKLMLGLEELALDLHCEVKDLASTLLVAAIKDGRYIICHIGDGVIGYVKNDELKVASDPENGEFVNTTVFVTSNNVLSTMKVIKGQLNGISGFVLMSDGTETSLYSKKEKKLAPALKRIMLLSQTMKVDCLQNELERSFENVIKYSTTDDCSLIFLVEEDYSFHGYMNFNEEQKKSFLGVTEKRGGEKKVKRYDDILKYLETPKNIAQVSKHLYLKKKHCRKYLDFLISKNLVVSQKGRFYTAVIMNK